MRLRARKVCLRVDEELLEEFTQVARLLGMSRSEAIRKAMEMFIASNRPGRGSSMTARMRGLVRSGLSLKELEEMYLKPK
ncbi:MAG: hypothetical protein DRO39_06785 [Thermoprotei archaeon]|nr:MAG: hypothetical protein DRO39_06785 [Thermoprotei archaeon]